MSTDSVKFLVVDDREENLFALEKLLQRDGLEVLKARSGSEALELLLVHDFALALLDVQMPEMSGFELAELMRGAERTRHVPIIFVTAGSKDRERMFKGYDRGAVDFLYKPIDPVVLKSKADVFFELYRQRRELQTSLKLNELFVGILGHDLRNPLSAIITAAQAVARKQQQRGEPPDKHVQRMREAGARMTEMIEQMLDLTRARLGGGLGFVRSHDEVDLAALARRAADELHGAWPDRSVTFEVHGDVRTRGDEGRLLQVLSNLIGNALVHGRPDVPVTVKAREAGDRLLIEVHNAGVIPREVLPTLFDPFRARQRGSPTRGEGLGLGLFIAQQIARAHGGEVSVTSTAEQGTCFTVRLPRFVAARAPARVTGCKRVLLVDDDADVRGALSDAFQQEGYETLEAENGQAALDVLAREGPRPDVIVLDMAMPVMDGPTLFQKLQAHPTLARIPVVISTSLPQLAPQGALIVKKPVSVAQLLAVVADVCR